MFGAYGRANTESSVLFVSKNANTEAYGLSRRTLPVSKCRGITKADMVLNDYCPNIEVDSQTYEVRVDGELLTCEPAEVLPLAQRYFLF